MAMADTETGFGAEYRWWEVAETLYAVADYLCEEKNASGKDMMSYYAEPWIFTSYYEEWFDKQVPR